MMLISQAKYICAPSLKIVSLVPSQTELLYYLGLEDEVIGITKFCVHPAKWFKTKRRVGGTKTLCIDLIKNLNPTLIIANKEENVKEQVELLSKEVDVWVTDVNSLQDALLMIADVGILTAKTNEASQLIQKIEKKFLNLDTPDKEISAAYLIWKNPYMAAGGDTFISNMMQHCGLQNVFNNKDRYPEISMEQIKNLNCQLLLLSSEPYPFKQDHLKDLKIYLPETKIVLVDGEMFSWYGSRLLKAPAYFKTLFLREG
jgi:ABC-type Fe3+-hydroxamate transport system substrate-binding protein